MCASTSIQKKAETFLKEIRILDGKQVQSKTIRLNLREYVVNYFSNIKKTISGKKEDIDILDSNFQELLRFTQLNTSATKYIDILKEIIKKANELEIANISTDVPINEGYLKKEQLILNTLKNISITASKSYEQGLIELKSINKLSWRGTAVEFREALREVLDHLAPDSGVESQPGYKKEKDTNGPTMKQKVVFILKSRHNSDLNMKLVSDNVDVVDETVGGFVRSVYRRSSVATHLSPSKDEAIKIKEYVTLALVEILEITNYE